MSKEAKERERNAREKAYRKESQKIAIRGLGKSTNEQKKTENESIKTKGEKERHKAATMIDATGSSLQESVNGQFGNKVVAVFEQQKQLLNHFYSLME